MVLLMTNGEGMRGGAVHHTIEAHPFLGEVDTAPRYRFFSVRNFPNRWAPWDVQKVIGDMFSDKLRPGCPTLTSLCLCYQDEQAASSKANYKFMRTSSLADSKSARLLPQLKDQSREWEHVSSELRLGKKLVQAYYTVGIISPKGSGDAKGAASGGADSFGFAGLIGRDLVHDFRPGEGDTLRLNGYTTGNGYALDLDDVLDLSIAVLGGNTVIDIGASLGGPAGQHTITLRSFTGTLDDANVVFTDVT